jgi:Fur family ferric uptake transcriptional regulator
VTPQVAEVSSTAIDEAIEQLVEVLRSQGHRVTTPRRLLIRSLIESGGHRTVDELTADVQRRASDVHLSTIYRNLDELERLGLIEHAHGHGAATYHLASHTHGHLVCRQCGTVVEVPEEFFRSLVRRAESDRGFAIDPHHFAMIGLCESCRSDQDHS